MDPSTARTTTTFGRYELVERLGAGGMAEVWLAQITGVSGFKKTLVIKTMHEALAESPDLVKMFIKEAALAARLNHPNIVQIFDLGELDGRYFIAMEYIPGRSLRQIKARVRKDRGDSPRAFPPWFLLNTIVRACDGLHYSHDFCDGDGTHLGLVHRDISPENIMVSFAGAVKLLDFGVAKMSAVEATMAGNLVGKFGYMAPEQIMGGRVDRRTDIYALGVVLYELLTGVRPIRGANEVAILRQTLEGTFVHPREVEPSISEELAAIILKAMARDPAARYQDTAELQADLMAILKADRLLSDQKQMGVCVSSIFPESTEIPADIRNALAGQPAGQPAPVSSVRVPTEPRANDAAPAASAPSKPRVGAKAAAPPSAPPVPRPAAPRAVPAPAAPASGSRPVAPPPPKPAVPDGGAPVGRPAALSPQAPGTRPPAASEGPRPARANLPPAHTPPPPLELPELDWHEIEAAEVTALSMGSEPPPPNRVALLPSAPPAAPSPPEPAPSPPAPSPPEVARAAPPERSAVDRPITSGAAQAPQAAPPSSQAQDTRPPQTPRWDPFASAPRPPSASVPDLFVAARPSLVESPADAFAKSSRSSSLEVDLFAAGTRPTPEPPPPSATAPELFTAKQPRPTTSEATRVLGWGPFERIAGAEPPPPPMSAAKHFEKGLAHVRARELDQALAEWERAVALEPQNRSYQSNLQRLRAKLPAK